MTGTKYIMGRDRSPLAAPLVSKKCKRCDIEKPNNFVFFGKKQCQTRDNFVTNGICKTCTSKAMSDSALQRSRQNSEYKAYVQSERDTRLRHLLQTIDKK